MAMGLEMLMKSMGVDPEEIKGQFTEAQQKLAQELTSFHQQLNRIEKQQQTILNWIADQEKRDAEREEREVELDRRLAELEEQEVVDA